MGMAGDNSGDRHYSMALNQIKNALKRSRIAQLSFHNLKSIPPEISAFGDRPCYLTFTSCSLHGMDALQSLSNLTSLHLNHCSNIDTNTLSKLLTLKFLTIYPSDIIDNVDFVAGLTNLLNLSLRYCEVKDLAPLGRIQQLTGLHISHLPIEEIRIVSKLTELTSLSLFSTRISSIDSLVGLTSLSSLRVSDSRIDDMSVLSKLEYLYSLSLTEIETHNIPQLTNNYRLYDFSLAGTNLSDLNFIRNLSALGSLDISYTKTENLEPLRELYNLVWLSMQGNPISTLESISNLTKLKRLDVSNTRVRDLSPISHLTQLARGPRGGRVGGLFYSGSPIADKSILQMSSLRKADRADNVIAYLRKQQGLPALWETESDEQIIVPPIPSQEGGPHFSISEMGLIDFAPPSELDTDGNNVSRLQIFHPKLGQLAKDLSSLISPNEQPHLSRAIKVYLNEIIKPLNEINFDVLYGEGMFLEEAAQAAERDAVSRISPPLEDTSLASLNSLIHIHGIFMLSTKAGLENIELAQRYEMRPDSEMLRYEALAELAAALDKNNEIASDEVTAYVSEIVSQLDPAKSQKQQAFKASTVKNIVVVLTAGASIAALPLAGVSLSGPAGGIIGAGAGYVAIEGLKKSAPFLEVSGLVKKSVDGLSDVEIAAVFDRMKKNSLQQYFGFVEEHEPLLRKIANVYGRTRWLDDHLDWIRNIRERQR